MTMKTKDAKKAALDGEAVAEPVLALKLVTERVERVGLLLKGSPAGDEVRVSAVMRKRKKVEVEVEAAVNAIVEGKPNTRRIVVEDVEALVGVPPR